MMKNKQTQIRTENSNAPNHRFDGKGLSPTLREASIIDAISALNARSITADCSQEIPTYMEGFQAGKAVGKADGYRDAISGAHHSSSDNSIAQNSTNPTKGYDAGFAKGYKFGYDVGHFKGTLFCPKAKPIKIQKTH